MRSFSIPSAVLLLTAGALSAQNWEVGASGGYGFSRGADVTRGSISGKTGFDSGVAAGAVIGNDMYPHFGGELRYTFLKNDLEVSSGGTKATAAGQAHALHYDLLIYGATKREAVRPFFAIGAGVKLFRGTGAEPVFQPLSNLVVLTKTSQTLPLISIGAGVKFAVSRRALVRLDIRDYVSPFPDKLLAFPPSSSGGGWIHNFVAEIGVSTRF
jgi:outer membrane protein with beta-barrel domain